DLHLLGTNQSLRLGQGQRRPQGPNVHDLAGLGVQNSHCRFLLSSGVERTPVSAILGRLPPGRPRSSRALPPLFLVSSGRQASRIATNLASSPRRGIFQGPSHGCREPRMLKLKRAYEAASKDDGLRILVERLWPRGVSKQKAQIDLWL